MVFWWADIIMFFKFTVQIGQWIRTRSSIKFKRSSISSKNIARQNKNLATLYNYHFVCPRTIWVLWSFIVKHAFCNANKSQFGAYLKLLCHDATIFWLGKGDGVEKICSKVRTLLKVLHASHIMVIYCGSNNIPASKEAKTNNQRDKEKSVLK